MTRLQRFLKVDLYLSHGFVLWIIIATITRIMEKCWIIFVCLVPMILLIRSPYAIKIKFLLKMKGMYLFSKRKILEDWPTLRWVLFVLVKSSNLIVGINLS